MKIRFFITLSILCVSFLFFTSCDGNKKSDSTQEMDDDYRKALRENMSSVKKSNKELKQIEENGRKEHEQQIKRYNEISEWLQGTWLLKEYINGQYCTSKLTISDDYAVMEDPSGTMAEGNLEIDMDENTIHINDTYLNFDFDQKKLGDFKYGYYFQKVSSSSSVQRKASKSSTRSKSNKNYDANAPYGYNDYGEPYASKNHAILDKNLKKWDKARQLFISADNPMDKMYYQQEMRLRIDDCYWAAKGIGDSEIIAEIERLKRATQNMTI